MISKIKKLFFSYTAKDLYLISIGNFFIIVSGFIFTILAARNLAPEAFGIFSSVTSLILIFSDLGDLGIGGGLSNFLPPLIKLKDRLSVSKILKTTLLLQLFFALIICLIFFSFSQEIALTVLKSDSFNSVFMIRLAALGIIFFIFFNFFNAVLAAQEKFKKSFWLMIFYSIPRLLVLIVTLLFINLDISKTLLIFLLGPLVGVIAGIKFLKLGFIKAEGFYPIKKILGFSVFLSMNKIFVTLFSRLDIIMLTSLASSYAAGIYSAALRVAFIYPVIGGSLGTILAPRYARLSLTEAIKYSKKVFLLVFALIFSVLLLIFMSPSIINLIYGLSYYDSIWVLRVLLLSVIPFLLAIPTNSLLTYTMKKPQVLAFSSLVQLILIFSLNLSLIPKLGGIGGAISVGIASLTAMLISFIGIIYFLKES